MSKIKIIKILKIIGIPVGYALVLRLIFGVDTWEDLFSVMTITFLICLPFIVGVLTIYFSPLERVKKVGYRAFAPIQPFQTFYNL